MSGVRLWGFIILSHLSLSLSLSRSLSPSHCGVMAKKMRAIWEANAALSREGNQILLKLFGFALIIAVFFHLFFPRPAAVLPTSKASGVGEEAGSLLNATIGGLQRDMCDLFSGEWIPNNSRPAYTNESCPFIEPPQNCMKNGRPDTGYLYWRWKPHGCDVSPFDGDKFLEAMRNKTWALIGDSIFRNHAQSLICLLSKVEEPVEVYHDEEYKSRRWRFPSHNFTLSLVWSPFLVKAEIFENENGESNSEIQLHIDTLDSKWSESYHYFDYVVISAGQWFLKTAIYLENSKPVGCHSCSEKNLTELGFEHAYRTSLENLFNHIAASDHKPLVIYRTWTPDHFENGEWFSGGTCNRSVPYKAGEYTGRDVDHLMRNIELQEFEKFKARVSGGETLLKLLDTYSISLLRPDGHPGPYRNFHPFDKGRDAVVQSDCLHWCLPGPIDAWNDLLMKLVLDD